MAYQKTDGTEQDVDYILGRLKDGFSFDEAIQGMKMPIDPGTPERPGWCYRNKALFLDWAKNGKPSKPGLTSIAKRVVGYATTPDGKVWAIHPDNTRTEVKAPSDAPPQAAPQAALVAPEVLAMPEENISKAAKRSRRKAAENPKEEW